MNRYWDPGKKILKGLDQQDKLKFHKFVADEYHGLLIKSIDSQRFKSKWSLLNPEYLKYKITHGYSTNIWELTGELKKSMKVRKRKDIYTIGFPKNKKHSKAKMTYLSLAKIIEFGNVRVPPRPLYRLVLVYMNANIKYFYDKYNKRPKRKKAKKSNKDSKKKRGK